MNENVSLYPRERHVLRLVGQGLTSKEIATELRLSHSRLRHIDETCAEGLAFIVQRN